MSRERKGWVDRPSGAILRDPNPDPDSDPRSRSAAGRKGREYNGLAAARVRTTERPNKRRRMWNLEKERYRTTCTRTCICLHDSADGQLQRVPLESTWSNPPITTMCSLRRKTFVFSPRSCLLSIVLFPLFANLPTICSRNTLSLRRRRRRRRRFVLAKARVVTSSEITWCNNDSVFKQLYFSRFLSDPLEYVFVWNNSLRNFFHFFFFSDKI